jgi:hypothetical protein
MSKVMATQADPDNPSPDEWRPAPSTSPESERAMFLKEWGVDHDEKPARKEAPADDGDDDLDEDADETETDDEDGDDIEDGDEDEKKSSAKDDDEDDEDEEDEEEDDPDDDSDLDEDDDEDEKPSKDPAVDKGMAKLQRKEQQLRQQIDRERESLRAEVGKEREAAKQVLAEAEKLKAKYEQLGQRAKVDPLGVLEELGLDDAEYIGKQALARVKGATDPAFKEAAARLQRDKERDRELAEVKRKLEERDKSETEAKKSAEQQRAAEDLLAKHTKAAASVPKATLTNLALKNDPEFARGLLAQAHLAVWNRDGAEPAPGSRVVVLEAEKMQRAMLRRYGISPKTIAAASPSKGEIPGKANGKSANGKANKKAVRPADDDDLTVPTREQLLAEDWKL